MRPVYNNVLQLPATSLSVQLPATAVTESAVPELDHEQNTNGEADEEKLRILEESASLTARMLIKIRLSREDRQRL